jgi:hypothetical protein
LRTQKPIVQVTEKGEIVEFSIVLPRDAQRIVGLQITNNDVGDVLFVPSAPPYSLPTTTPLYEGAKVAITESCFEAVETTSEYAKWDTIKVIATHYYEGDTLVKTTYSYRNFTQDTEIDAPPRAHLKPVEAESEPHLEVVKQLSFALTNVVKAYPFAFVDTFPPQYRQVKCIVEADATTDASVNLIARFGTNDVSATLGYGIADLAGVTLSRKEFENAHFIGLQVGKTHTVQLTFIN